MLSNKKFAESPGMSHDVQPHGRCESWKFLQKCFAMFGSVFWRSHVFYQKYQKHKGDVFFPCDFDRCWCLFIRGRQKMVGKCCICRFHLDYLHTHISEIHICFSINIWLYQPSCDFLVWLQLVICLSVLTRPDFDSSPYHTYMKEKRKRSSPKQQTPGTY